MEGVLNELGSIHPPYYSTTFEKGNKAPAPCGRPK
jgi:hypothetical protein